MLNRSPLQKKTNWMSCRIKTSPKSRCKRHRKKFICLYKRSRLRSKSNSMRISWRLLIRKARVITFFQIKTNKAVRPTKPTKVSREHKTQFINFNKAQSKTKWRTTKKWITSNALRESPSLASTQFQMLESCKEISSTLTLRPSTSAKEESPAVSTASMWTTASKRVHSTQTQATENHQ